MILFRSFICAVIGFLLALWLKNLIDPERSWVPAWDEGRRQVVAQLPWFGAMMAASYAALYTRFASQWAYLSGVYNQIKTVEASTAVPNKLALAEWKAAFIEDCDDLHLIRKSSFAATICIWSRDSDVTKAFAEGAGGGKERFDRILLVAQAVANLAAPAPASVKEVPKTEAAE